MSNTWKYIAPLAAGAIVLLFPAPQGLTPDAWHFFALFLAVVVALILEPIPAAAAGFMGVTLAAALRLVQVKPGEAVNAADAVKWALTGFSNDTVWLIFMAFMFALGYEKTGLGKRISLNLIRKLGKSTLGLGYAVTFADLCLAPFMPSNTARSGGTIFPIIKNIPPLYGSTPQENPRRLGAYLMWTALAATCVTSSMFITALAPNLLALSILGKTANINISWTEWFTSFLPVGVILLAATPYLAYKLFPPELKRSEDAPRWAASELAKMGSISSKELIMAGFATLALVLWIFGGKILNGTTVALIILCLMLLTRVLEWKDVTGYSAAWNVLVWFATLVTLADGLNKVGFLKWISTLGASAMAGYSINAMVIGFVIFFFVSHYLFASVTAHVTALLPVVLSTAMTIPGLPLKALVVLLCTSLGIMGIITPYGTGPSPIYYGSGYIAQKDFWRLGIIFGAIYLALQLALGVPYMLSMIS